MSLINKMLQDLDARGNARGGDISSDVKPVAPDTTLRSRRRIAAITAGLLAVALGVTAWTTMSIKGKSFDPKPAPAPVAQASPPAATTTEPTPVTVAEVAPPAAAPAPVAAAAEEAVAAAEPEVAAPVPRTPPVRSERSIAPPSRSASPAAAPSTTTWAVANARFQAEQARLARRWTAEEARIAALPAAERAAAERRLRAEQDKAAATTRADAAWVAALKRKEGGAGTVPGEAGEGNARPATAGLAADAGGRSESGAQRADNSYRRALASLQDGRVNEAITGLQQTLRTNPRHDAARQTLVGLLVENKRSDEAVLELQGALALDARQPAMAMLLARLQIERGGNGIETLLRTLPYAGGNGEYQAFLAGALQRQNRHREAIDQYGAALRGAPNNGVWWMGLGLSLQAEKRNADAADAYRRAQASGTLTGELQGFVERKLQQVAR